MENKFKQPSGRKVLCLAIAAAFSTGASFAAHAALTLPAASIAIAKELPTTGTALTSAGFYNIASASTSFTPSAGQNLQVTVTLDSGAKFTTNPSMTCSAISPNTGASAYPGATMSFGGAGLSTAIFTLTQAQITAALGAAVTALDVGAIKGCSAQVSALSVTGTHATSLNASMTYSYGSIATESVSGPYLSYVKSLSAGIVAGNDAVAQVSGGFVGLTGAVALLSAGVVYYVANSSGQSAAGGAFSVTAGTTSASLTVAGNALTAVTATGGVYLVSAAGACVVGNGVTGTVANNSITFSGLTPDAIDGGLTVCTQFTGTTAIPAGAITATLAVTPNAGYSADTAMSSNTLVNISHNGTTLVAPLVNVPGGWISRLVLVNRGSSAAAYTVTAVSEVGTTVSLAGAAGSGTLAAGSNVVVDLSTDMTTVGSKRGSLQVVVDGVSANVDGLYQIVNAATGSLSNYTLINK